MWSDRGIDDFSTFGRAEKVSVCGGFRLFSKNLRRERWLSPEPSALPNCATPRITKILYHKAVPFVNTLAQNILPLLQYPMRYVVHFGGGCGATLPLLPFPFYLSWISFAVWAQGYAESAKQLFSYIIPHLEEKYRSPTAIITTVSMTMSKVCGIKKDASIPHPKDNSATPSTLQVFFILFI